VSYKHLYNRNNILRQLDGSRRGRQAKAGRAALHSLYDMSVNPRVFFDWHYEQVADTAH
jgi:hypothetical protein